MLAVSAFVSSATLAFAQAPLFPYIDSSGTYTVDSGVYEGSNTSADTVEAGLGVNITVNVDSTQDGTVEINSVSRPSWLLDAYGSYWNKTDGGSIVWNGNLIAHISAGRLAFTPVMVNDGGSSIVVNGNIAVDGVNNHDSAGFAWSYAAVAEYYSSLHLNGDVDFSLTFTNNLGIAQTAGVAVVRGESVNVSLGASSANSVHIHDVISNGATVSESYGISGVYEEPVAEGYPAGFVSNYVIDVKGSALIENIQANASSAGGVAWASGAEANFGTINFLGNTVIRDIKATGSETYAYALTAYNGGTINVNVGTNNIVQIDGDLDVQASGTINLQLTNADSYLRGGVSEGDGGQVNLVLKDGGTWYIDGTTSIHDITIDSAVIDIASGGRFNYDGALVLNGTSKLVFHSENPSDTGRIVLGASASLDFAEMTQIEVYLSDFYGDIDEAVAILLIDSESIAGMDLDVSNLDATFKWESSGQDATGWFLEFIEGEGLYASCLDPEPIPEPASVAMFFGLSGLAALVLKKRKGK